MFEAADGDRAISRMDDVGGLLQQADPDADKITNTNASPTFKPLEFENWKSGWLIRWVSWPGT
jgi:hypothetical protein